MTDTYQNELIAKRTAALAAIRANYNLRKADLKAQADREDITQNEYRVFGKREAAAAKQQMDEAGISLYSSIRYTMESGAGHQADDYVKSFLDPSKLDLALVDLHREVIARKIERAGNGAVAQAVVKEALSGPLEAAWGLWKAAPAIRGHRVPEIKMLSEQAERALTTKLKADPAYVAAVESQRDAVHLAEVAVRALVRETDQEIGGLDLTRDMGKPLGAPHQRAAGLAYWTDHFALSNGAVAGWNDSATRGAGKAPDHIITPHELPDETGGGPI